MKYLSVCSGVEAATLAWEKLGWEPVGFSEIEPFPSAVLAHHWPDVPNLGDMTQFHDWPSRFIHQPDLLVGGTPCQGFSVAGLRGGLDDPRSQLSITYVEIAALLRPRWIVWENVPGVLSSAGGADFAEFLGTLTGRKIQIPDRGWRNSGVIEGIEEAYGVAWRVLDAQFAGVPQRRRRVFVVGYLGNWRRAAAVLFERESLRGNPPPSRPQGQRTAEGARNGSDGSCYHCADIAPTLNAHFGEKQGLENQHIDGGAGLFVTQSFRYRSLGDYEKADTSSTLKSRNTKDNSDLIAFDCKGSEVQFSEEGITPPLRAMASSSSHQNGGGHAAIAFAENSRGELRLEGGDGGTTGALSTGGGKPGQGTPSIITPDYKVRRLTPIECERLQGMPDNHTRIPWRGKPAEECPDGPRYKAIGNSMAVPCMRWIGERISLVETTLQNLK